MKWNPKNLEESLLPFNFVCRILCLRASECLKGRYKFPLVMLHFITIWNFRILISMYQWSVGAGRTIVTLAASLFFCAIFTHTIGMMCVHFANIYFTRSYMLFIKNMMKIDETLVILGAPVNHRKELHYSCNLLLLIASFSIIIFAVNVFATMRILATFNAVWLSISTAISFINDMILILDFCVSVRVIGVRFEAINKFLVTFVFTTAGAKTHQASTRSIDELNAWCLFVSRPQRESKRMLQAIHTVKQVHLQLSREIAVLCKIYAIPITVAIGMSITFTTSIVYNVYIKLVNSSDQILVTVHEVLGSITFCGAFIMNVLLINSSCEHTLYQAEKMKSLIHVLHGVSTDTEVRNEVQQLALEIALRPLRFRMFGYNLNYSLVRSYFGCVSTYLLISIQLGECN